LIKNNLFFSRNPIVHLIQIKDKRFGRPLSKKGVKTGVLGFFTMIQQQNFGLSAQDCERLQRNDQRLQTKLFDKYAPNFVKISVHKWGVSVEDAEDIVSWAFAKLFSKIVANTVDYQQLEGYVYTIVKHKCWEYTERNKKNILETREIIPDIIEEELDNELMGLIDAAFKLLGDKCQHILQAFYWDKKDHKELALELDISEDASRQRKRECMKKLKEIIKEKGY
jgi:RNA polymerase sigma factor (sigma-70 family)